MNIQIISEFILARSVRETATAASS